MKLNKLISTAAFTLLLVSGTFAQETKAAKSSAITPPVVGGATIGIEVTQIMATGYRASKLIGSNVYNEDGDKIGKVDDIVISGDNSVSFAVISVGGFLGIGARNVAVPANLFQGNEKGQIVLPKASKDELLALPAFQYAK